MVAVGRGAVAFSLQSSDTIPTLISPTRGSCYPPTTAALLICLELSSDPADLRAPWLALRSRAFLAGCSEWGLCGQSTCFWSMGSMLLSGSLGARQRAETVVSNDFLWFCYITTWLHLCDPFQGRARHQGIPAPVVLHWGVGPPIHSAVRSAGCCQGALTSVPTAAGEVDSEGSQHIRF